MNPVTHHEVAQQHRNQNACREEPSSLVYDGSAVGISVEGDAHVGPLRHNGLLAGVNPRLYRVGVNAPEVLARFDMHLHHIAPKVSQQAREVRGARPIHGVNDHARGPPRDGATIHDRGELLQVGPNEIALLERAARLRRGKRNCLFDLVEEAP